MTLFWEVKHAGFQGFQMRDGKQLLFHGAELCQLGNDGISTSRSVLETQKTPCSVLQQGSALVQDSIYSCALNVEG